MADTKLDIQQARYVVLDAAYLRMCYALCTEHVPHIVEALRAALEMGQTPTKIRIQMALADWAHSTRDSRASSALDGALEYLIRQRRVQQAENDKAK